MQKSGSSSPDLRCDPGSSSENYLPREPAAEKAASRKMSVAKIPVYPDTVWCSPVCLGCSPRLLASH